MRFSFSQNARFSKLTFYAKFSFKYISTADLKSLDKTNNFLSLFSPIASFAATQRLCSSRKVTSFRKKGTRKPFNLFCAPWMFSDV